MKLPKALLLSLAITACGSQSSDDINPELVQVDEAQVPKTVIFETDASGESVAYYLMDEQLNSLGLDKFKNMDDQKVEKLIQNLTQNKLRVASSAEDIVSDQFSISVSELDAIGSKNKIATYGSPYSYSSSYGYNPSYGYGYDYSGGVASPFGSASGYARGYGSGYNAGSGYSRGFNNGYESSYESAGEAEGRVSGGGEVGGSLNLGWLNLGFNLGFNYDLGYKFGYKNKSYRVYRPSYPYSGGYAYGSTY